MDKRQQEQHIAAAAELEARERRLDNRVLWANAHAAAADERDAAIAIREELVQLREAKLEARREAEAARVDRERLIVQIRSINEQLVVASLQAQASADEALAARAAADEHAELLRSLVLTLSAIVWPYAYEHQRRSSESGDARVRARAVPSARDGALREWIGMMVKITDRARVDEAHAQLIEIFGHDLQHRVASVAGGVELLGELAAPQARIVARLARTAARIEAIVDDLLEVARGRLDGSIPIAARPCDLGQIGASAIEDLTHAHPTRTIRFEGAGDLRGAWDPDRIEHVIASLVGNAIAYGAEPVIVTSRGEPDQVVTTVRGNGPPIPDAAIPTLFDRDGVGRGLYIASELVHAHGGTLAVSSSSSDGAVFTFTLPRSSP